MNGKFPGTINGRWWFDSRHYCSLRPDQFIEPLCDRVLRFELVLAEMKQRGEDPLDIDRDNLDQRMSEVVIP